MPSWGLVVARPRQQRRCLRSAIRLALPGEPTMRRDSAGAATQTWAVCMRAAHAWACVLRNCISVCACVRHGPGARVPERLSMPPASSSADSQEVQCMGGAPHPRAPGETAASEASTRLGIRRFLQRQKPPARQSRLLAPHSRSYMLLRPAEVTSRIRPPGRMQRTAAFYCNRRPKRLLLERGCTDGTGPRPSLEP